MMTFLSLIISLFSWCLFFFFYPLPLLSSLTDKELRADKEIQEYELQAQRLTLEEQRKYIEQLDNAFKTAQANVAKLEAELRERSNGSAVTSSSLSSPLNVMNVTPSSSASSSQTVLFQPESSSSPAGEISSPVDTHHLPRSSNNSTSGIDSEWFSHLSFSCLWHHYLHSFLGRREEEEEVSTEAQ